MYIYKPFTKKELKDHCDDWDSWNELIDALNEAENILAPNSLNGWVSHYEMNDNGKFFKDGEKITKKVLLDDALRLGQDLANCKYWNTKKIRDHFYL